MRPLLLALALFALILAIRITAPSDIATGDQPYERSYISDIARNGNWVVQHFVDGTPASKPPLYNWLAAPGVIAAGHASDLLLKLPSMLAGLALLLLTWDVTRRLAGERAAVVAAMLLVTTTMYVKLVYFARTDMLLAALIAWQMHSALTGRVRTFWIAAALAMLTKGPVGIALPLAALIAWWWWRGELRERWRELRPATGFVIALLPFLLWFAAALWVEPLPVWNEMVMAETVDRFAAGSKSKEHRHVFYYLPHFLGRMAPASLFACVGLTVLPWRTRRDHPMFFAAAWLLGMLVVMSLVPSKRADRLFPMLPAACVLAAWVIETNERATRIVMSIAAVILLGAGVYATSTTLAPVAGIIIALLGAAMLFLPRHALAFLIATLVVINGTYQHKLSVPAKQQHAQRKLAPSNAFIS